MRRHGHKPVAKKERERKAMKLSEIKNGETFKIGEIEFIKFNENDGKVEAVTKECVFNSKFGENNNFKESEIIKRLENEFLPEIVNAIGKENLIQFETDLLSLDGMNTYGKFTSRISLPTFDFYRRNVEIFDKYNPEKWWWLSTPDSTKEHSNDYWVLCVSPRGNINGGDYFNNNFGVRPFCIFNSSIFVS